jgi:hypothetical protein
MTYYPALTLVVALHPNQPRPTNGKKESKREKKRGGEYIEGCKGTGHGFATIRRLEEGLRKVGKSPRHQCKIRETGGWDFNTPPPGFRASSHLRGLKS